MTTIYVTNCPFCGKKIYFEKKEQRPGFRDYEELNCPHCDKLIERSMEYEYYLVDQSEF